MKIIRTDLNVGKTASGLDMYCDLSLEQRHLYRMKCESFVGNLLKWMRIQMGKTNQDDYWDGNSTRKEISNITSITESGQDIIIELDRYHEYSSVEHDLITIQGVLGLEGLNGVYFHDNAIGLFPLDRHSTYKYYIRGIVPHLTGVWDGTSGVSMAAKYRNTWTDRDYHLPINWEPIIGMSNQPVKASDLCLPGYFKRGCTQGAVSITSLITDQESSKFTLSRPFTNMTGGIRQIKEIGIMSGDYRSAYMLMARDVLGAPISLGDTSTLSLDYEIISMIENFNQDTDANGTNGGWTESFMYILHRIANPGAAHNWENEFHFTAGLGGGGTGVNFNVDRNLEGWQFGVRVGESNKFVSMTDTSLTPENAEVNGVPHGYGDGELVHHGTHIGQLVVDDVANEVYFPIERIFENRGATPITVREIGLFGNKNNSLNIHPHLLARKALAPVDQFTIGAGETAKVTFNCKAIV
ncbi:MAG: hypothetical protein CL670_04420 [Balneola sp.]|nr:hypothetical protein [Balneola sp.]MBE78376.1 hypothetical protein [Balneola sp.]|tara:strand:- start:661 stop:2064 length:1404 start_codon:yes stop_codon:yes gene_type:complete